MRYLLRFTVGLILVFVAFVCLTTTLPDLANISTPEAQGKLFGGFLLAAILGVTGFRMMLRKKSVS